ncbi:NADPH:quinone oxidoreductase family protein [Comamonas sp. J-3]|uniref:NADPH:quinone oxidoreductase family protein n=1 Tax=Comamonas trifloxystrobinivorans TaxID=3350256 RepID=UPI0037291B9B
MKALLCQQFGPPELLQVEELPALQPAAHEVVVDVKAAGINYPDTLIIENRYQIKAPLPFSPGGEFAGVVQSVGADVSGISAGQAVIGFVGWGAFAEQICVQPPALFPMPAALPFEVAGSFLMTYGTAYHALRDRAALAEGETVLVLGAAGGLGIASIELAKALGARVIAAASSPEKLAVCRAHGADETIDYEREDLRERLKALTGGRGVDVVCDAVGGRYSEPALRSTAWRGRFLVLGFAGGEIPRIALNLPLLKGCAIVGVFWGDYLSRERANVEADITALAALYQAGRIRPLISQRFSLADTPAALQAMRQRQAIGKGVVLP